MYNPAVSRNAARASPSERAMEMKTKDDMRRHAPSPASSEDIKELTPQEVKRRAQNRASQRAFRERKRAQTQTLQQQVQQMKKVYEELLNSLNDKEQEVSELYEKVHALEYKLQMLRAENSAASSLTSSPSFQFEPVALDIPYDRWSADLFQTPMGWDSQNIQAAQFSNECSL